MHNRWVFGIRGLTAALSVTAALLVPTTPAFGPRALVSGPAAIPSQYLAWYQAAARTCPGLEWEVLAGIGTIESDNGRSHARGVHHGKNRKGAEGPMQFEPATFAEYAVRADRAARLSPYNPPDAIFSAARMLCADGARGGSVRGLRGAIFAYNHAHWYVRDVLALAARYAAAAGLVHLASCRTARRHRCAPWALAVAGAPRSSSAPRPSCVSRPVWVWSGPWRWHNARS